MSLFLAPGDVCLDESALLIGVFKKLGQILDESSSIWVHGTFLVSEDCGGVCSAWLRTLSVLVVWKVGLTLRHQIKWRQVAIRKSESAAARFERVPEH